jgi:hypothetical protein
MRDAPLAGMTRTTARRWFLVLATLAVPLLAAAALAGVAWGDLYRGDAPSIAAQAIGQDWVTLVLAVPLLAGGIVAARRGSALGHLVVLGVLAYAAYGYTLYAFGSRHNELFLVYVAVLGCAVWGLVAGFVALGPAAAPPRPRLAWRWIGGYFVACAVAFAAIWLGDIVPALLRREPPATVIAWNTPTNGVYVLDLAFVLPILAWTGVRLWRRDAGAVPIAGVLLFKVATLGLAILAMGVSEVVRGGTVDTGLVTAFVAVTAIALAAVTQYVWAVRRAGTIVTAAAG